MDRHLLVAILPSSSEYSRFSNSICIFLHAFLAMSASHELAVISCSNWIYPLGDRVAEAKDSSPHANIYKDFHRLDASLKAGIPSGGKEQHQQQGSLSRSLSMALAFINRLSSSTSTSNYYTSRRILLISSTRDSPSSYIPTMNCIFSSQKMGVPIDVVRLFAAKTSFLAHASVNWRTVFILETPSIRLNLFPYALCCRSFSQRASSLISPIPIRIFYTC